MTKEDYRPRRIACAALALWAGDPEDQVELQTCHPNELAAAKILADEVVNILTHHILIISEET